MDKLIRLKDLEQYRNDRIAAGNADFDEIQRLSAFIMTVDAVEVVRCKECVFGELDNIAEMYRCRSVSFPHWNKGEHFCSYGEKETDHE